MKTPEIYAEWCEIFDKIEQWEIGQQNADIVNAMEQGSIRWVSGVAERVTQRLLNLINRRLTKLQNFFNRRLSMAHSNFEIEQLLIMFRKELLLIKKLESLKMLPESLRNSLTSDLLSYAKKTQQTLEDNSRKDLTGMFKRLLLNNRIDNI